MDRFASNSEKVAFSRSMFVGRKNVFARRFESAKTGKKGYSPYCENQWVRGVCGLLKGWSVRIVQTGNLSHIPMKLSVGICADLIPITSRLRWVSTRWTRMKPFRLLSLILTSPLGGVMRLLLSERCGKNL